MKKNLTNRITTSFFLASLAIGGVASAQEVTLGEPSPQELGLLPPNDEASTACHTTLTSGAGATFMKVCVSNTGNIMQFESPATKEHIRVGDFHEGYSICSSGVNRAHDDGDASINFNLPVITQPNGPNTLPLTIVRASTNGWTLTQTYTRDSAELEITVTMKLQNFTGVSQSNVQLARFVDPDVDNITSTSNDKSAHSVWARSTGASPQQALSLNVATLATSHFTDIDSSCCSVPLNCSVNTSVAAPNSGDNGMLATYNLGTLSNGASKTVKFTYRRN